MVCVVVSCCVDAAALPHMLVCVALMLVWFGPFVSARLYVCVRVVWLCGAVLCCVISCYAFVLISVACCVV